MGEGLGQTMGQTGGLTPQRPSKLAEAVVAFLIPPASREEIVGDLHERYRSSTQYAIDAARTIPLAIVSRIRRTADPQVVLMQAFALYLSFLGAAWLRDRSFLFTDWALLRLAIPAAVAMLGLILEDAWTQAGPSNPLLLVRGPAFAVCLALLSQASLRLGDPRFALPNWLALFGGAIALLFCSVVRMLFPPAGGQLHQANAPAHWLRRSVAPIDVHGRYSQVIRAAFVLIVLVVGYLVWTKY